MLEVFLMMKRRQLLFISNCLHISMNESADDNSKNNNNNNSNNNNNNNQNIYTG